MLFDRRCPGCARTGSRLCGGCRSRLRTVPVGHPGPPAALGALDSFSALLVYDPLVARLLVAAKNRGQRDLLTSLGAALGSLVASALGPAPVDAVAWVPASRARARERGFDQGALLGRSVGRAIGSGARPLLARERGHAQANRSRADRLVGPSIRVRRVPPASVLLVDDVATTGASLAACAERLRHAGAVRVHGAVVAVVDDRRRSRPPSRPR